MVGLIRVELAVKSNTGETQFMVFPVEQFQRYIETDGKVAVGLTGHPGEYILTDTPSEFQRRLDNAWKALGHAPSETPTSPTNEVGTDNFRGG